MLKKQVKKAKRKQPDEKINYYFKKNDSHNLLKSERELERKPKKSFMLVKNQKKDRSTKTEEVLKIWKNILINISIQNFLMMKISCNPFLTPHLV